MYKRQVYTTARIHEGINRSYCMTEKLSKSVRYLEKQVPMMLEDFRIESFEVPHDGTDNVGSVSYTHLLVYSLFRI